MNLRIMKFHDQFIYFDQSDDYLIGFEETLIILEKSSILDSFLNKFILHDSNTPICFFYQTPNISLAN